MHAYMMLAQAEGPLEPAELARLRQSPASIDEARLLITIEALKAEIERLRGRIEEDDWLLKFARDQAAAAGLELLVARIDESLDLNGLDGSDGVVG